MATDNHIFLKNGSEIFGLGMLDRRIGLHRVVKVRFFALAMSFIVERRAWCNGPTGWFEACPSGESRARNGGAVASSTARTIAGLAPIGTVGVA